MQATSTPGEPGFVSTGTLPARDEVRALVEEAYARFRGERAGHVADYIPVLAEADPQGYGLCVAGTHGEAFALGDADVPFSIQSVSKPFVSPWCARRWEPPRRPSAWAWTPPACPSIR